MRWSCLMSMCQMAKRKQLALAPGALCDIYEGLRACLASRFGGRKRGRNSFAAESFAVKTGRSLVSPGGVGPYYPAYFTFAWLGFYFLFIYGVNEVTQFPDDGLIMKKFVNRNFINMSFAETVTFLLKIEHFFEYFFRMVSSFVSLGNFSSDEHELTEDEKDFALCLQPGLHQ
ncbi:hypothetical protein ACLOJK_019213 [Asimina triloba]